MDASRLRDGVESRPDHVRRRERETRSRRRRPECHGDGRSARREAVDKLVVHLQQFARPATNVSLDGKFGGPGAITIPTDRPQYAASRIRTAGLVTSLRFRTCWLAPSPVKSRFSGLGLTNAQGFPVIATRQAGHNPREGPFSG